MGRGANNEGEVARQKPRSRRVLAGYPRPLMPSEAVLVFRDGAGAQIALMVRRPEWIAEWEAQGVPHAAPSSLVEAIGERLRSIRPYRPGVRLDPHEGVLVRLEDGGEWVLEIVRATPLGWSVPPTPYFSSEEIARGVTSWLGEVRPMRP